MQRSNFLLLACVAASLLQASTGYADPPTVKVRICRFESSVPVVTNQMADDILAFCTTLMKDNGCEIKFVRDGDVRTLPDDEHGGVLTNANYGHYQSYLRSYHIRLFNEVAQCANYSGVFAGCSSVGIHRMSVNGMAQVRNNSLLWLHEFGHNCGLPDIDEPTKIMNIYLSNANRGLRPNECSYYMATATSINSPDRFDLVTLAAPGTGEEQLDAPPAPKIPVQEFVRMTFPHGVPIEEARRYGAENVKTLLAMLYDKKEEPYWSNVVETVCLIGDPSATKPLIEFFQKGDGKLSPYAFQAKKSVLLHLGKLINASKDKEGEKFLLDSVSDLGTWTRRKNWIAPYGAWNGVSENLLADSALTGIALTGTPEALESLKSMQRRAAAADATGDFDSYIEIHESVRAKGLEGYIKDRARASGHHH